MANKMSDQKAEEVLIDDAAVIAVYLRMVEQDLHKYKQWKKKNV